MKIEGKVALVSGGASGLGAATVRMFLEAGGRVAIVDRDEKRGAAAAEDQAERTGGHRGKVMRTED